MLAYDLSLVDFEALQQAGPQGQSSGPRRHRRGRDRCNAGRGHGDTQRRHGGTSISESLRARTRLENCVSTAEARGVSSDAVTRCDLKVRAREFRRYH